jgi:hypothetical protein
MRGHRQLHLWITEADYSLLSGLAAARRETLSSVIRRLIKCHRITGVQRRCEQPYGPAYGTLNELAVAEVLDQEG